MMDSKGEVSRASRARRNRKERRVSVLSGEAGRDTRRRLRLTQQ